LEQAVFLLLDNAKEATATHVRVELSWGSDQFFICICDNGTGFIASLLPHIGLHPVHGKSGGSGIGLYMLRYMMENMGGTFTALNDKTGGACVRLGYPIT
jgi:signal transduction histidine kinase